MASARKVAEYSGTMRLSTAVTLEQGLESKEDILNKLKSTKLFTRLAVVEEVGETGFEHYHVGWTATRRIPKKIIDDVLTGAWYTEFTAPGQNGRMGAAWYLSKDDKAPALHDWPTFKTDAQRFAREKVGIKVSLYDKTPKQLKELLPPMQAIRTYQAAQAMNEAVAQEEREFQNEMTFTVVDYDYPNEPFKFHFDFNTGVFTDDAGQKRIGVKVLWIMGPTATGKTTQMIALLREYKGYRIEDPSNWTNYKGEQLVAINDFDGGKIDAKSFRELLDCTRANVKYASKELDPSKMFWVITSNYHPEDSWCTKPGECSIVPTVEAILRCCMIVRIEGKYKCQGDGLILGGGYTSAIQRMKRPRTVAEELMPEKKAKAVLTKARTVLHKEGPLIEDQISLDDGVTWSALRAPYMDIDKLTAIVEEQERERIEQDRRTTGEMLSGELGTMDPSTNPDVLPGGAKVEPRLKDRARELIDMAAAEAEHELRTTMHGSDEAMKRGCERTVRNLNLIAAQEQDIGDSFQMVMGTGSMDMNGLDEGAVRHYNDAWNLEKKARNIMNTQEKLSEAMNAHRVNDAVTDMVRTDEAKQAFDEKLMAEVREALKLKVAATPLSKEDTQYEYRRWVDSLSGEYDSSYGDNSDDSDSSNGY